MKHYTIKSATIAHYDSNFAGDPMEATLEAHTDFIVSARVIARAFANDLTRYDDNTMGVAYILEDGNDDFFEEVVGDWN